MKARILICKVNNVKSVIEAKKRIQDFYPNCRVVSSRFTENYAGGRVPDWNKRTMEIAIVDDAELIWDENLVDDYCTVI